MSSKEHLVAGLGIGRPTDDESEPVNYLITSSACAKILRTGIVGNYDSAFYISSEMGTSA